METIKLHNGILLPKIGYGVYQIPPSITQRCVREALDVGYRSIDTAQCYCNEAEVGKAIRASKIQREDIFVTTKLWGRQGYADTVESIERSLQALDLGYIDLLLIHEPTGNYHEIYRAMEDAYHKGMLRAIGVANFLEKDYQSLLTTAQIVPMVNQVETHVFRQQHALHPLLEEHHTVHEAWSPLACGQNGFFTNPVLKQIGQKYGKTNAQVGLRFLYQQDIVVIPKSTHTERMKENLDILDFTLDNEDMNKLVALDLNKSMFNWW